MSIRVLLADHHPILMDSLHVMLEAQRDIEVVGKASDGRAAVTLARKLQPHILVAEISIQGIDGIEATHQVRLCSPATRTLILTAYASPEHVHRALAIGASGYLLKQVARAATVVDAIRTVHRGERYFCPTITAAIVDDFYSGTRVVSRLDSLTRRERQILMLIVESRTSAQAAAELSLSPKTVETYRSRMMHKLGIRTLPGLVKFAIQHGLTPLA